MKGNPVYSVQSEDGNLYSNHRKTGQGNIYGNSASAATNIELVGEADMGANYRSLNEQQLEGIKNCLVIGVSHVGLQGCRLNWQMFDNVYYTEPTAPAGITGNFLPLGMYAKPLMQQILF